MGIIIALFLIIIILLIVAVVRLQKLNSVTEQELRDEIQQNENRRLLIKHIENRCDDLCNEFCQIQFNGNPSVGFRKIQAKIKELAKTEV